MDIQVNHEFIEKAVKLHRENPVADAHLDLAGEILLRKKLGEKSVIRSRYLESWKSAGLNLLVSSVYVPTGILEEGGAEAAWEDALLQIEALKEEIENTNGLMLVCGRDELHRAASGEQIGILLYMEGLDCVGQDLGKIEILHTLGVRGASLTWSRDNALARGCCKAGEKRQVTGGLTGAGKAAVAELERLSMFLDVSHLNDDGFKDVEKIAKKAFCATHSCAREVYDNYRNLTDEQIRALAERGGVMGLNGCKYITGSLNGNHLEMLCAHGEYEVKKAGAAHVGFGFDLCDSYEEAEWMLSCREWEKQELLREEEEEGSLRPLPPGKADCLSGYGQIPLLTAALLQRGMQEEVAAGIMGKNWISYFDGILP